MTKGQRRPEIPNKFEALDDRFFSLGQDDSYYDNLNGLGADVREMVLRAMQDVALDLALFNRVLDEMVTGESLLRSVSKQTVLDQYHRMAHGGARLTQYNFSFTSPKQSKAKADPFTLNFVVEPASFPPTNIHVLIGRNGVGKTTLLNSMAKAVVEEGASDDMEGDSSGVFGAGIKNSSNERLFTGLVSVTFSAFDPFEPLPDRRDKSEGVRYAYIGLKHVGLDNDGSPRPPKTPEALSSDFSRSVLVCGQGARVRRWRRALQMLEADPIFSEAAVATLPEEQNEAELKKRARTLFKKLSSGHKIVLLTITRLVETVDEKTLVLLDEPEAHLHPPLLSAFVRALSDLLIDRNGVALIATHSPVVLQEVPSSCVWIIRRSGVHSVGERPEIETFGENVGILTREVFGLEVTQSGFHKMLRDAVAEERTFSRVLNRFDGELGSEARAVVQGLLAAQTSTDENDL